MAAVLDEQPERLEEEVVSRIVAEVLERFRYHGHRTWGMHNIVLGNPLWHPYYWTDIQDNVYESDAGINANVYLHPIYFPAPMTISRMTCNINVAGGVGTFLRLGLYADNGGTPVGGALLYDSGNIDANVTGPINALIAPALARPKGVSTWAAFITDSALLKIVICPNYTGFIEIGAEMMNSCTYAQAFGAFTNPCPAVGAAQWARFWGFVRVDSVQPL